MLEQTPLRGVAAARAFKRQSWHRGDAKRIAPASVGTEKSLLHCQGLRVLSSRRYRTTVHLAIHHVLLKKAAPAEILPQAETVGMKRAGIVV